MYKVSAWNSHKNFDARETLVTPTPPPPPTHPLHPPTPAPGVDKPSSEPMVTKLTDVNVRHMAKIIWPDPYLWYVAITTFVLLTYWRYGYLYEK